MSESVNKAVFLSYASQDADAAKRICEALRGAGVEVWFDQNELVGGDAWDAKIRKQIAECALFVPIISASTQARLEGYFRIEWKLAAQRTHAMAEAKPFLLPVVIDGTRDADAHVPGEFRAVQWTRLVGGETPEKFCARVKKLLGGSAVLQPALDGPERGLKHRATQERRNAWLVPAVLGASAIVAFAIWRPWNRGAPLAGPAPVAAAPPAASPSSELARLRVQIIPDRWQKEDFEAVSTTLDRLIQSNPEMSDAWALRSIINSLQVLRNFDPGTKPLEVGKAAAERARRFTPESSLAELALGMHLVAMISRGGDPQAGRPHVVRAIATLPADALTRYADLVSVWLGYDTEGTERIVKAWLAAEPRATFPAWILAQMFLTKRQAGDAEKWAETAAADRNITGTRALYTVFESKYYLRGDLAAAEVALARVPAGGRTVHRVVHARWLLAMAEHRWDEALQELARVPEPLLFDRTYHGPRSLLAGLAHQRAGRPDAAAAQFRDAERLLREQLLTDSDSEELHAVLAVALACAGRATEARSELTLVEPLLKGRASSVYRGPLVVTIAQAYGALGDFANAAQWLRQLFAEPNGFPFTPVSLRFDPRFSGVVDAPEIQALLMEFAALDQPKAAPAPVDLSAKALAAVDQKSVAVLAFANLSDDKANEYFSDGISEELLNVLAKVPGLKVSARTSAFYFKGKQVQLPEIAKQLGVAYVVEGSVRKSGGKVRITAQLIKAADGFHAWSDTFTRDLRDVFAVQDEIAGLIANKLSVQMGVVRRVEHQVNPDALALLLEGRHFWALRSNEGFARAGELFSQAVKLDPQWATAYAALASLQSIQGSYLGDRGDVAGDFYERAKQAARRALELDPNLGEPYAALGHIAMDELKWSESAGLFAKALALEPNNSTAHDWNADLLSSGGRLDEALAGYRRALELDPLSPFILWDTAWFLMHAQRYAEALPLIERATALTPVGSVRLGVRRAYLLMKLGRRDEAGAALSPVLPGLRLGQDGYLVHEAIACLQMLGRQDEARQLAADLLRRMPNDPSNGFILVAIGRTDEAYPFLERTRPIMRQIVFWDPMLDPLRDSPRFQQVLAKLHLAEEYQVARAVLARMLQEQATQK